MTSNLYFNLDQLMIRLISQMLRDVGLVLTVAILNVYDHLFSGPYEFRCALNVVAQNSNGLNRGAVGHVRVPLVTYT